MTKIFFGLISYLFHPLLMPLVGVMIVLTQNDMYRLLVPPPLRFFIALVLLVFTILFPVFTLLGMRMARLISSLHLPLRNERRYPLLMGVVFYTVAWWLIKSVNEIQSINYLFIAGLFTLAILLVLNHFIKLSIHMAAIGGLTGMFTVFSLLPGFDSWYFLLGAVMASGLVASSRLYLKAHTVKEVIWGYTIGFLSQYILLLILLYRLISMPSH